jgi:hypothetical protein
LWQIFEARNLFFVFVGNQRNFYEIIGNLAQNVIVLHLNGKKVHVILVDDFAFDVEYVDFEVHDFFDFRGRNFYERRFQKVVEIFDLVLRAFLVLRQKKLRQIKTNFVLLQFLGNDVVKIVLDFV